MFNSYSRNTIKKLVMVLTSQFDHLWKIFLDASAYKYSFLNEFGEGSYIVLTNFIKVRREYTMSVV